MRNILLGAAAAALVLSTAGAAGAVQCKDAKGRFIKCPPPAAARCRDKTSKQFAKCGAKNAEPVPVASPAKK